MAVKRPGTKSKSKKKKLKTSPARRHPSAVLRAAPAGDLRRWRRSATVLKQVSSVIWPRNNPDAEWSSDTVDEIARILWAAGYGPKRR